MFARLTSKGELTLRKSVRDKLHLREGDKVEFLIHEDGRLEVLAVTALVTLKGTVPPPKRPLSLEEMDEAIGKRAGRL